MSHSKTQELNLLLTPTLNKFYPYIDRKERISKNSKISMMAKPSVWVPYGTQNDARKILDPDTYII
jgi:hypothetical protein